LVSRFLEKWGLGIGDWGFGVWGCGANPKPQNPKPQTQNPNKKILYFFIF